MKTYTLSLSTLIDVSYNAYGTNVVDKTNLARVKWFVNWAQFFKYEDHGKNCKIKVKLYSKKSISYTHDGNLGFLTCSLPSSSGNMVNGTVLGQTLIYPSGASTTDFYIYTDTLQESGVDSLVPTQAGDLTLNFIDITGALQLNIKDYIVSLVFEIPDEDK